MKLFTSKLLLFGALLFALTPTFAQAGFLHDLLDFVSQIKPAESLGGFNVCFPGQGCTGTSTIPGKGALLVGNASGIFGHLATSSNGLVLTASSGASLGVSWENLPADSPGATTTINGVDGPDITFATSSDTNIQLVVTTSSDTVTFAPGWTGALGFGRGGTATSTSFTAGSLLFSNGTSLAQDNANLFWDDTNNRLGIGTASPLEDIHIASTSVSAIMLDDTNAGTNVKRFRIYSNNGFAVFDTPNDDFTGSTNLMGINLSNGNVGIGTTSPINRLTLYNTIDVGLKIQTDLTGTTNTDGFNVTVERATSDVYMNQRESANILILTSNSERARIDSNGQVGIKDTSPDAMLDIVSRAATTVGLIVQGAVSQSGNLTQWTNSTDAILAQINSNGAFVFNEQGADADSRIEGDTDINLFYTDASTDRVGIGTATPSSKLDVAGSFQADSITNDTGLAHGTSTPTLTNVANLDGSTAYEVQYIRVGNTVTVSGRVDIDPTSAATSTQLGISLPVASNFGAIEDCAGTAFASGVANQGAAILADTVNDRAQMQFISGDLTNQAMYFTFTYQVI